MLTILFKALSETLLEFGANPKNGLGGKLGFISLLHTWDRLLNDHFHLHCLVPGKTAYLGTAGGFKALVNSCFACDWVVDIRDPIEQPEYVFEYLARYTHRVAIFNNRILSLEDGKVTFTYKNRDTG